MGVERRVVVVGAGMGGLAASVALASRGFRVTTVDAAGGPGGKMREVDAGGRLIDSGPTVLTMRWVFDRIFEDAGASLSAEVGTSRAVTLARHGWGDGSRLDLYSDIDRSADAIACFAGPREADGYRRFCKRAEAIYRTLRDTFISGSRTGPVELAARVGFRAFPISSGYRRLQHSRARSRIILPIPVCASCSGATPPIAAHRLSSLRRRSC